jgi:TPR repeat protein
MLVTAVVFPRVFEGIDVDLAGQQGLSSAASLSHENLQLILKGVERGDPDKMYLYGLLKLYGISLSQNATIAVQSFKAAAELGKTERGHPVPSPLCSACCH